MRIRKNHIIVDRARLIKKTLGIKAAAGYLRNREYSVEAAVYILLGK